MRRYILSIQKLIRQLTKQREGGGVNGRHSFYASVEMLHHPEFAGMPLAVGGDPEARHGIVLTANYIAKQKGIKTGMALWQAKQICPEIIFVPP